MYITQILDLEKIMIKNTLTVDQKFEIFSYGKFTYKLKENSKILEIFLMVIQIQFISQVILMNGSYRLSITI